MSEPGPEPDPGVGGSVAPGAADLDLADTDPADTGRTAPDPAGRALAAPPADPFAKAYLDGLGLDFAEQPRRRALPAPAVPEDARTGERGGHGGPGAPGDTAGAGGSDRLPYDPGRPVFHRRDTPWLGAHRTAMTAARQLEARDVPLGEEALGTVLARGLVALTDLPPFDSSAMDGWALAGAGPWRVAGQVLAGQQTVRELADGHAVRVATGAELPPGATAVLRSEHGAAELRSDGEWLRVSAPYPAPVPGQEVRRRGQECRAGEELLPAGSTVTPAVLGLAAASGYDELAVVARPRVEVLVLGDELQASGRPGPGRTRDALGPMLPPWLRALGAEVTAVRALPDDAEDLRAAIVAAVATGGADLVVTTGGTASGPRDHVHGALVRVGARLRVDGVAVRPGHPMLMAEFRCGPYEVPRPAEPVTPDGRPRPGQPVGPPQPEAERPPRRSYFVGLPGNPLAAAAGVLTLVAPLLRTLGGHPAAPPSCVPLGEDVGGHREDTRLVPVVLDAGATARPLPHTGSAMLRGLAAADAMAVIPPGGVKAGQEVQVLDLAMAGPIAMTGPTAGPAGPVPGRAG
ncbi:molybdopterin molybdotransferase [Actinacidiphila yanglinensis]|uniref:Molybdopterin molybdenumtransferase n=1 Tax=Actinacidiphila yanglinensis TaxID=310779 RepID=A0A1H6A3M0_9ACTN|nr:molybdopterin molybdotransferase MoeA [Actinacidiphila yanglinensis]SEG42962.1 molybdopterin molybdotransferase [Actinacidiphila yanglinensis]